MIGDIVKGTISVLTEIISGIATATVEVLGSTFKFLGNLDERLKVLNTKMMGSYTELEALKSNK